MQSSFQTGEKQQGTHIPRIVLHQTARQIPRIDKVAAVVGDAGVSFQGLAVSGIFTDEAIELPQRFGLMAFVQVQVGELQSSFAIPRLMGK